MRLSEVRIAIDGGAATGKTVISQKLAEKLNIQYISTGLIYRLVTHLLLEENLVVDLNSKSKN